MSTTGKLITQFGKPLTVGLASGLASVVTGQDFDIQLLGVNMPHYVYYGLLGFGSSQLTELGRQFIAPHIPVLSSPAVNEAVNGLLAPVIHAGINTAAVSVIAPEILKETGMWEPAKIGFAGEIVGDYAWNHGLGAYVHQMFP